MLSATSNLSTLGGKLKYYRLKANMLQEDFAQLSNVDVSTIKRFENNNVMPTLDTCNKLAFALKIEPLLLYDDYLQFISSDYSSTTKATRKKIKDILSLLF